MNIIAVCKDCGNGTLNGESNPQFTLDDDVVRCMNCSSSHVYVVSEEDLDLEFVEEYYVEKDKEDEISEVLNSDPFSDEPFEREVGA